MCLQIFSNRHKTAIAAAITGQTYGNMLSMQSINGYFQAEFANKRTREILLFNSKGSLFYASPDWQKPVNQIDPQEIEKLRSKAKCMQSNYNDCLNVLFAVNRFLKTCPPSNQPGVPKARLDAIKNSIRWAFLDDPSSIYYKHVFDKIAPIIGLNNSLKRL